MNNSELQKKIQLGMSVTGARHKLLRALLFRLVVKLGLDNCFRCGKKINDVSWLTIEHKKPWLHVDVSLFWDVENICFSHSKCNSGARRSRAGSLGKRESQRRRFARMYSNPILRDRWNSKRRERYKLKEASSSRG